LQPLWECICGCADENGCSVEIERYFIEESGPWYVIPLADLRAKQHTVGSKGVWLARLSVAGLPIPTGFHITTAAYRRFVIENRLQPAITNALQGVDPHQPATLEAAAQAIREAFIAGRMPEEINVAVSLAYANLPGGFPAVAVRSSATTEEQPGLSFASQQAAFLNISSIAALFEAIKRCWASLWTSRAIAHRLQHPVENKSLAMAVVVQVLVPAQASGVLFTADPTSGARDQAVIHANWGLGETVAAGLVTPDRFTLDKATGRVVERQVANKSVWAVRVSQGTEVQTLPRHLCKKPALDDSAAARLMQLGLQIESMFHRPVDIEWTYLNGEFAIVQARPVTALPEGPILPRFDWSLPDRNTRYLRSGIVELLPDPLSPLFATLGCRHISLGMQRLVRSVTGGKVNLPDQWVSILNGYAYLTYRFTPSQYWKMLIHILPKIRKLLRSAEQRWREQARPGYIQAIQRWEGKSLNELGAAEILKGVNDLLERAIDHYTALQSGIIPAAGISEIIFSSSYNRFVRRKEDPPALSFLLGFDSTPILAEKSLYDLARWCQGYPELAGTLLTTPAYQLASALSKPVLPARLDPEVWNQFQEYFQNHLQQFGHSIYELDFAKQLPLDDPTPLLEAIKFFLSPQGTNPYLRQQAASEQRKQAYESVCNRIRGLRRALFQKLVSWAQKSSPLREDGLADIGLGWPLMRKMLLELGKRLAETTVIDEPEDIFWLQEDELVQAASLLDQGQGTGKLQTAIRQRKVIWQAQKRLTPPPVLPQHSRMLGFDLEKLSPARVSDQDQTIHGIGACPGQVTAQASVVIGSEDFGRMSQGKIIVAAITTPAWTPLFALAAGVVTDVGGPFSHSSIVAREYGIPAVLGTGVATRRVQTSQMIAVDGNTGSVSLVTGQLGKLL
jgi:phosphohistidine swiveling domain-containing protein